MKQTRCCIVGGGPAGMMAGYLLARAGVDVLVLEKHKDFLRDFRGDTIHPSTLELMHELGILPAFLERPHQELRSVGAQVDRFEVTIAEFDHLPVQCKFIAFMPQWDFLNFIAGEAKRYPRFQLMMEAEFTGLVEEQGIVKGVRAKTSEGELEVRADLTIGADGRHSLVRKCAGLEVIDWGAPIDVLWMRLSRHPEDPNETLGQMRAGKFLITINRGDYWQCAFVIEKGSFEEMQKRGIEAFHSEVESAAPFLHGRARELTSWDQIKLLTVKVDHLRKWHRPGLLCIGDAAHAMSPVGGIGINLAIQDAVAAANILAANLRDGPAPDGLLERVQRRREFPTRMTQRMQVFVHKNVIYPALRNKAPVQQLPLPLRLVKTFPALRRIPARIIGLGLRPEHVQLPER